MKALILAVGCSLPFLLAWPASADIVLCTSGNLSAVIGTACDIGNLQFYFTQLASYNSVNYVPYDPLSASDFTFTVVPDGFELSVSSPQTITGPSGGYAQESYALNFDLIDETNFITGAEISGGGFEVSNPSQSIAEAALIANDPSQVYQFGGTVISGAEPTSLTYMASEPLTAVSVQAGIFTLYATNGSTATFDATIPTSYTFLTSSTPPPPPPPPSTSPEPRGISIVLIGGVGLGIILKRKSLCV